MKVDFSKVSNLERWWMNVSLTPPVLCCSASLVPKRIPTATAKNEVHHRNVAPEHWSKRRRWVIQLAIHIRLKLIVIHLFSLHKHPARARRRQVGLRASIRALASCSHRRDHYNFRDFNASRTERWVPSERGCCEAMARSLSRVQATRGPLREKKPGGIE